MQIICTKKFLFTHPKTQQHFIVSPNTLPQEVPNWIASERLFELASADGAIQIVAAVKPAPKMKAKEPTGVAGVEKKEVPVQIGIPAGNDWPKNPQSDIGLGFKNR